MALQHLQPGEAVNLHTSSATADAAPRWALVKTDQFQAIYVSVAAGSNIPKHSVPGQATVQCLTGIIGIILDDTTVTLSEGDWMYLDRNQEHAVEGIEDGALLVTILFDSAGQ